MERAQKITALAAAALAAGMVTTSASAASAGDWIVRAGPTLVAPNDDSSDPSGPLEGLDGAVSVDNDTQLGLTVGYFVTNNIAVELLAATPFSHDISGEDGIDGLDVGSTKHLPPTLSVQYHFDTGTAFRPYAGVGLNYTMFFDEDVDSDTTAATGYDDLSLDDSFGLAGQVGFDYELGNNWLLNADIRYIDIDTEATLSGGPNPKSTIDVDIDPWVYTIAVGYRF
ncbi:Outer membrane protein W [wastewater metagenome]|uniref:Outer membrane protein W n=3 Tax=root TaxID=1 RepID=A0A5B8RB00_9ZZZZ|nr:OmpW family outer membrane protein [Arhodomonas aquaeolei]MCS4504866.1 outer membrane beta-barrel protein [Arhodomonas aquaeolei]QEA05118.1 outer membrane protein W [uncultured organism]